MPQTGPIFAYRRLLAEGKIQGDPQQELAAEKLQALHVRLTAYRPAAASRNEGGFLARLGFGRKQEEPPPQGLYIYGDVGRGKSMLMDLFFESAPVARKRRVHFHAFMQEVHAAIYAHRQRAATARDGGDDPIPVVAAGIADGAWLLCFDEFQVTDVADAMILGRLFQQLFDRGTVVVATSNRAPDDLYLNGINRSLFLPFIALFKQKLDLHHLDGPIDFRLVRHAAQTEVWHVGPAAETAAALDRAFAELTDSTPPVAEIIDIQGHKLAVPATARGVARFRFADLCDAALGAADYLAIAARFSTVILDGIPQLDPSRRDAAKRFTTLIDALYEARVKLIASAQTQPEAIYPAGDVSFEFHRTASRLIEMRSADYLKAAHLGRSD